MKQHVDSVVAHRVVSPELVFQPERGIGEWSIVRLRHLCRQEPDSDDSTPVAYSALAGDVGEIVPNKPAPEDGGQIDDENKYHERGGSHSLKWNARDPHTGKPRID